MIKHLRFLLYFWKHIPNSESNESIFLLKIPHNSDTLINVIPWVKELFLRCMEECVLKKNTLCLFFLLRVYDWCVHGYMHKHVLGGQRAM